jgi:hypothetical protein
LYIGLCIFFSPRLNLNISREITWVINYPYRPIEWGLIDTTFLARMVLVVFEDSMITIVAVERIGHQINIRVDVTYAIDLNL